MRIRKKFIWLMILMIWVGMVTSIILYQGNDYLATKKVTSDTVEIEDGVQVNSGTSEDINFTENKDENSNKNFFTDYRLEREKVRSKEIERYREIINSPNYGEAYKNKAQEKMLELTAQMEKEMEIESLIRARGYKDALAYIHKGSVDVIVKTQGLSEDDVTRIGDIIVKTTGLDFDDVTIIEKKKK
mgnify:CR=1 FL=1